MKALLLVDGLINLGLGVFLIAFPRDLVDFIGLPQTETAFYPSLFGAVLFGIGIALLLERRQPARTLAGLGLGGAIAINVSAAVVLAAWLLAGHLAIPYRARLLLWLLVGVLFTLSVGELYRGLSSSRTK